MATHRMPPTDLLDHLAAADPDALRTILEHTLQRLIEAEATAYIGAEPGNRRALLRRPDCVHPDRRGQPSSGATRRPDAAGRALHLSGLAAPRARADANGLHRSGRPTLVHGPRGRHAVGHQRTTARRPGALPGTVRRQPGRRARRRPCPHEPESDLARTAPAPAARGGARRRSAAAVVSTHINSGTHASSSDIAPDHGGSASAWSSRGQRPAHLHRRRTRQCRRDRPRRSP